MPEKPAPDDTHERLLRFVRRTNGVVFAIFLMIANRIGNPLGLLVGLAVVVLSLLTATIAEVRRI